MILLTKKYFYNHIQVSAANISKKTLSKLIQLFDKYKPKLHSRLVKLYMRIILPLALITILLSSTALDLKERDRTRKALSKDLSTEAENSDADSSKTFKFEQNDVSGAGSFDQNLADYKDELQDFKSSQLDRYINQKFRELSQDGGLTTNGWRRLIEGALEILDFRQEGLVRLEDKFEEIDKNKNGLIDIDEARITLNDEITKTIKDIEDYLDRKTLILTRSEKGTLELNLDDFKPLMNRKQKKTKKST